MPEENNEKNNSFIKRYAINFTEQEYVVNPAIGREKEIKELALVLLTPDKSAILTGKPGIGKTAIVEGLAYLIQRNEVPEALKGYTIIKVDTQALMGTVKETGDSRVQTLIDEIAAHEKYILFIDEIHTLVNATTDSALDFAQMFKTGLGRGDLKVIGATTTAEYEKYILRDKAFTRRFEKIEIAEPDVEMTVKIVTGVIPRIEKNTGIKMGYTPFIQEKLARFITEITTEYNRVYETAGRYPDVAITMFSNAFSEALFDNKSIVTVSHVRKAIEHSKAIYPDVIKKALVSFDQEFDKLLNEDKTSNEINVYAINKSDTVDNKVDEIKPIEEEKEILNNVETSKPTPVVPTPSDAEVNKDTINTDGNDNENVVVNEQPSVSIDIDENDKSDIDQKINTIDSIEKLNKAYDRIINPFDSLREDK